MRYLIGGTQSFRAAGNTTELENRTLVLDTEDGDGHPKWLTDEQLTDLERSVREEEAG